jgi:hypothetical protein
LSFDAADGHPIWRQVVGIVKNTRDQALDRQAEPAVYMPMEQGFDLPQFLGVRTRAPPPHSLPPCALPWHQWTRTSLSSWSLPRGICWTIPSPAAGHRRSVRASPRAPGPAISCGLLVSHGMAMTLAGVMIGLIGAVGLSRLPSELLYEVQPTDPATLAMVSMTLSAVAFAARYLPARRALNMDPMAALRKE